MGADVATPIIFAPTASNRMFHVDGEIAVAATAQKRGTIYCLSTLASSSFAEIGAATSGHKWLQVYVWKDRGFLCEMLAQARASGFTALVLTIDVPAHGNRERDHRNQFFVPPRLNLPTAVDFLAHPSWLASVATSRPINAAIIADLAPHIDKVGTLAQFVANQFDRALTWADFEWIAKEWRGPVAIKGILSPTDAERAIAAGAQGIFVSNHCGRQLGCAPATIDVLPEIATAVAGRIDIVLDGGIRRGTDVIKALALGAKAVAIGRAYLYGLSAGGARGVDRAFGRLQSELVRSLALVGCSNVQTLSPSFIRRHQS